MAFKVTLGEIKQLAYAAKDSIWADARSLNRDVKVYLHWSAGIGRALRAEQCVEPLPYYWRNSRSCYRIQPEYQDKIKRVLYKEIQSAAF